MVEQSSRDRAPELRIDANFDAAWPRLRRHLEARIAERFGLDDHRAGDYPDSEMLADSAWNARWCHSVVVERT